MPRAQLADVGAALLAVARSKKSDPELRAALIEHLPRFGVDTSDL